MCPVILNLPFKYSAHWKQQGITYLQYLGLNTKAVRGCLKVNNFAIKCTEICKILKQSELLILMLQ